jgi:tetratricopeptide (TPR) repeat protein
MTTMIKPRFAATALLVAATIGAGVLGPVAWQNAAAQEQREANVKTKRTPSMRENVYKQINRARDAAEQENFSAAMKDLEGLLRSNLNSYEAAMAYNLVAYVEYSRENYQAAMKAYEQVLAQEALPESLRKSTLYSLGQIQVVSERYADAVKTLRRWFQLEESPSANAYILLGQALFQLERYDEALEPIQTAVRMTRAEGGQVRENWLLLLRAIYYSQENYARLRDVLKDLIALYPKREYWSQLSAVYGELGQRKKQLATMESAYEQGLLETASDYRNLAQLLLASDIPYKAARVLNEAFEKGILEQDVQNLRTLADAWMLAKEYDRAEATLGRAADMADDGELYLRLAQIHSEQAEWPQALEAARNALERGDLDRPDQARVIEGLALYNMERLEEAKVAFSRAARYEESQAVARQWRSYIEREQERLAALERARRAQEEGAG